jgi:hypothetical protein
MYYSIMFLHTCMFFVFIHMYMHMYMYMYTCTHVHVVRVYFYSVHSFDVVVMGNGSNNDHNDGNWLFIH